MEHAFAKRVPFPFVLEELASLRPTIKRMFGFTYFYLDHKLLFSLRDGVKQQATNGIWIYYRRAPRESCQRVSTIAQAAVVAFRKERLGSPGLQAGRL